MEEKKQLMNDFSIADVITPDLIVLEMKASTKEEVILELTDLLVQNQIVTDSKRFSDDVFFRESEGMTGIGNGLAIPHGKSDSVVKTSLVIGKTHQPIKWESLDELPVSVVILFAVRNTDANTMHIKLLQKVAMLLADDEFIMRLTHAETKDELMMLLAKEPTDI